ncbi:MAG: YggS family pyridoxal phosphate-dependent enzyme [Candidatus Omnitrophota bacterium]|jgi:hypothetical protein
MISENIKSVRQRIARCCEKIGKSAEGVTLVCVTKEVGIDEIKAALNLGITDIGENRAQDFIPKFRTIGGQSVRWHFIGHLQTNKAKDVVAGASLIHSVDSVRLAEAINKEAGKAGKVQEILIQVNVSGEESKFGLTRDAAIEAVKNISLYPNINIKGLMTIAPEVPNSELARPCFRALREIFEEIKALDLNNADMKYLSMGMSNDFETAIEEGSNMVRVGRAIFRV